MFFEGAEKKFELIMGTDGGSLRDGRICWDDIVRHADAQIVSKLENQFCDAYLLSESSLFVFDHRAVMITCGQTRLVNAALRLLDHVEIDSVDAFIYERKNEQLPDEQKTNFHQDADALDQVLPGQRLFLGDPNGPNISVYHSKKKYAPRSSDTTLELLMHQLPEDRGQVFSRNHGWTAEELGRKTGISRVFQGFCVDSFLFDPVGYSLNAVRDESYYTVHVTPQGPCSYASFETNVPLGHDVFSTIDKILKIFSPGNCLVVFFQPHKGTVQLSQGRGLGSETVQRLSCGYRVGFCEIERPRIMGAN